MSNFTAQPLVTEPLTIQEAQCLYDVCGTVFVVDGDALAITVFDDDTDEEANYPITILSIE